MKNKSITGIVFSVAIFIGCHREPVTPVPEQELITTLQLTLKDTSSPYASQTFVFRDIDGDGGFEPTIDTILIAAGKVFHASLLLLDERNIPADTSTNEINGLNTQHQFFYQSIPTGLITDFTYLDFDDNNNPLGNLFSLKTTAITGTGHLLITLRHEPDKYGVNVAQNDITHAGGETDIQVDFPVRLY